MKQLIVLIICLLAVSQASFLERSLRRTPRILYGRDAKPHEFPHQVSLQIGIQSEVEFKHFCGGSIINQRWILTAAHCIQGFELFPYQDLMVKAGKHDLSANESTEQESLMEKYFLHENYTGSLDPYKLSSHDIALIKLATPFRINKDVFLIFLPAKDSEPTGEFIVSGWGAISDHGRRRYEYPVILQKSALNTLDRDICRRVVGFAVEEEEDLELDPNVVDETSICTGPLSGAGAFCNGDSGGPLISRNEYGETELVGLVSWSMGSCGQAGRPGVFVKVSSFVDWIKNTISNN